MIGFIVGFASLAGLIALARRGRHGGGCHGPRRRRGGCHGGQHGGGGCHGGGQHGDCHGEHEGGFGGPFGKWRKKAGRQMMRRLFRELDTSPGQEKAIKASLKSLREGAWALRSEATLGRGELSSLMRSESLDEEVLASLLTRQEEALVRVQTLMADSVATVHQALDPEQRERLAQMIEEGWPMGSGRKRPAGPYRSAPEQSAEEEGEES